MPVKKTDKFVQVNLIYIFQTLLSGFDGHLLTSSHIYCSQACQTPPTKIQSFGLMPGNFSHLAKRLTVLGIRPNDWFETLTVTYIYIYIYIDEEGLDGHGLL